MIKLNPPRSLRPFRNRRRRHVNLGIQQLEHALSRRHRRLQDVVLLAQVLNRTEKPLRVLHERDQHAERRHAPDHVVPPEPDDAGDGNRREYFDHRVIHQYAMMASLNASMCEALMSENLLKARFSRLKSCNTSIPETASCRKELIRAIAVRMRR